MRGLIEVVFTELTVLVLAGEKTMLTLSRLGMYLPELILREGL